ncbi:sulfotransferase family protein [Aspergillus homomorphus CBS 101889]|uniref:Putative NAD dependent epimerase/dehydratase n=1 Tax=Aspergillus homomorphus (strain CBS 101889) TaxID=1450537 RepID=A0A395I0P9_ASPHC|nr:putative NAD dependent epimerase/dehydratase [Aspergillus homomorphus CBS 101889]RAL13295.1 putative NAD dependent epimerase/dehydratase [Aspergillus homomorphus CBS 101889]
MGQTASTPNPDTQLQVIGAALLRTGRASFSLALSILIDGPVYHSGTQLTRGAPSELKTWIRILRSWLAGDRRTVLSEMERHINGYAAITDAPGCQLLPELLELYPDAKVVCTVHAFTRLWFLRLLLLPVPGKRHFIDFLWLLRRQWSCLYADGRCLESAKDVGDTLLCEGVYARHIAWVEENVPADRLVFFDEVPKEIPFPHVNDAEGIAQTGRYYLRQAMMRWVGIIAVGAVTIVSLTR